MSKIYLSGCDVDDNAEQHRRWWAYRSAKACLERHHLAPQDICKVRHTSGYRNTQACKAVELYTKSHEVSNREADKVVLFKLWSLSFNLYL